jgi:hypothetical protein
LNGYENGNRELPDVFCLSCLAHLHSGRVHPVFPSQPIREKHKETVPQFTGVPGCVAAAGPRHDATYGFLRTAAHYGLPSPQARTRRAGPAGADDTLLSSDCENEDWWCEWGQAKPPSNIELVAGQSPRGKCLRVTMSDTGDQGLYSTSIKRETILPALDVKLPPLSTALDPQLELAVRLDSHFDQPRGIAGRLGNQVAAIIPLRLWTTGPIPAHWKPGLFAVRRPPQDPNPRCSLSAATCGRTSQPQRDYLFGHLGVCADCRAVAQRPRGSFGEVRHQETVAQGPAHYGAVGIPHSLVT